MSSADDHSAPQGPDTLFPDPAHPPADSCLPVWLRRLATMVATGLGSGLSPKAPGTVGTLWAWAVFSLLAPHLTDVHWATVIGLGIPGGIWLSSVAAGWLRNSDPSSVVIDEIVAFFLVLWLITPCGWQEQLAAFLLFRFFDAVKPGPVGWADTLFHQRSTFANWAWWQTGLGIMLDDLVAAGCTLLLMAWWRF